ncbi:unnamed protein product [Lathyrus sativus]|nr:unnamed protein product [Lathyrus sativus]
MEYKIGLVFLLLVLTLTIVTEASENFSGLVNNANNDLIEDDTEFLMSSKGRHKYISYGALRANGIPCGWRGQSYYDCNKRQQANPYRRGCNRITHCARNTG